MISIKNGIHVLRSKHGSVCIKHSDRCFMIGFPDIYDAKHVQPFLYSSSKMYLTNYKPSKETSAHSVNMKNKDNIDIDIHIIPGSILHISKMKEEDFTPCYIENIPAEEFLMYPIFHNLGVILPYQISYETDKEISFHSEIVEAFDNPELFKHVLQKKL